MGIVRLHRVLLAMTSEAHPGVVFQSFECTSSCGVIAKNCGTAGKNGVTRRFVVCLELTRAESVGV
jgi:hypothetical protein